MNKLGAKAKDKAKSMAAPAAPPQWRRRPNKTPVACVAAGMPAGG